VLALNVDDPISWVTERARQLVYRAIELGWSGPPFDPIQLADILRVAVRPSQAVLDARLVASASGLAIEFNPNRPPGRMRYSIAHELGHALFPDAGTEARHRLQAGHASGEDSELEMLCNLAAAEILMPIGSFQDAAVTKPSIEQVLELRSRFDLSTEAVLLRIVRLARDPVAAFVAAPNGESASDGYRIEYVALPWSGLRSRRGDALPKDSVVRECTAVGFTAKGTERWSPGQSPAAVQCVGIPPYPGSALPRVAGLVVPLTPGIEPRPAIRYLVGDAMEPRGPKPWLIVHLVNDKTPNWGGTFARFLARRWPTVQADFKAWAKERGLGLGSVRFATAEDGIEIASIVAQHGYGPSPTTRLRYEALTTALHTIATHAHETQAAVHAPRIGAGEARGDWSIIEELLEDNLVATGVQVTIYDLRGPVGPHGLTTSPDVR
jgi:IrrE N-terminal-like domain